MQGWAEGATPPANIDTAASYTDFDLLTFEATEIEVPYNVVDGASTYDGTNLAWHRRYIRVRLDFGPRIMADATLRASALSMVHNAYFRVKDTRHASLGAANTVVFVKTGTFEPSRSEMSYLSWDGKLELITRGTV